MSQARVQKWGWVSLQFLLPLPQSSPPIAKQNRSNDPAIARSRAAFEHPNHLRTTPTSTHTFEMALSMRSAKAGARPSVRASASGRPLWLRKFRYYVVHPREARAPVSVLDENRRERGNETGGV